MACDTKKRPAAPVKMELVMPGGRLISCTVMAANARKLMIHNLQTEESEEYWHNEILMLKPQPNQMR